MDKELDLMAQAVLIHGRPFLDAFSLGRWVGFRWGKCEISVKTESPKDPSQVWRTRFITPTGAWDLAPGWDMRILRNVSAVMDQKLEDQERRREEAMTALHDTKIALSATQKFYGRLVAGELGVC